jgi:hypothetical protein
MNRKETAQVLAILKAAYPNFYKNLTSEDAQGIVGVWSMQFADMAADIVLMALNKATSEKEQHPPNIAEVKKKLESVHWEAYEKIERNYRLKNLSAEELATYKRIYEETQKFKFGKGIEPSISDMLPKREVKQIERSKGYG